MAVTREKARGVSLLVWFAVALLVILGLVLWVSSHAIVSSVQHEMSRQVARALEREYGDEIHFAAGSRPRSTVVSVYRVLDPSTQDAMLGYLESQSHLQDWHTLHVRFYDQQHVEVTQRNGGGQSIIRRNGELLREETVSSGWFHW